MKAKDFEFDGKCLSSFGFAICNFDGNKGLVTIDGAEITFNTVPSFNGQKYNLTSTQYEDCLEAVIQVCKYSCSTDVQEISSIEFREISKWLNRKKFLKFKILDKEHIDLYYNASVKSINRIEINGKLIGLELNIVTNSPNAFKEPRTFDVRIRKSYTWERYGKTNDGKKGERIGEYVTSYNRDSYPDDGVKNNYYYIYVDENFDNEAVINDISDEEGHIYPYTEIIVNENGNLNIHNAIEDRNTYIANCVAGEVIIMDYPIIKSSVSSHDILNDFNWNFFRVANTYNNNRNDLTISIPCNIKIRYSPIVKVGL